MMKKHNTIAKFNLVAVCLVLLLQVSIISAQIKGGGTSGDTKFGLTDEQVQILADKGISNIEVIEYPCDENHRCFAVEGDINQKLISVPLQVRDNCIQNVKMINKTKSIGNGKSVMITIPLRTCSGVYNYRDITEEEVEYITNNALNKLMEKQLPPVVDEYYPIPEGTDVQSKAITIGQSIGSWAGKLIGQIGGLLGL